LELDILLIIGVSVAGIGFIAYLFLHGKSERLVELLRPRDSRGQILQVVQETDIGLLCKKVQGVTHRFIKVGQGWTYDIGGKMVTKFFGIEGKAYTGLIKDSGAENVSVSSYLKWLWGEKFYATVPEPQRRTVETDVVGITVAIEPVDTEGTSLPLISADDIHDQEDNAMLTRFAASTSPKEGGKSWIGYVVSFLLGASLMFFLVSRGLV
jgi:hypothetical protein